MALPLRGFISGPVDLPDIGARISEFALGGDDVLGSDLASIRCGATHRRWTPRLLTTLLLDVTVGTRSLGVFLR
ncbi:MAG: hypothetical protein ACNA8W_23905, partial [Bradymonadaceae bacterium]